MYTVVLTSQQAKQARQVLGLSQGKVAGELGINRTYLSQFENGRYVFDDKVLTKLRDYYQQNGFDLPSTLDEPVSDNLGEWDAESDVDRQVVTTGVRVMDGFVVPDQTAEADVDDILTEYTENSHLIRTLCKGAVKRGFFGIDEDDLSEREHQLLVLMARNYTLVEQLHGHETVHPRDVAELETIGDSVARELAKHTVFRAAESEYM